MPWMSCAIRRQLSCSIASSRLPQMPCGLGSCCMRMAISPPTTSTTCTSSGSKLQSLVTCSGTRTPQWQTFFFWFWVGELIITHSRTCNERNHKCQTEGHPQPKLQATLTTWVEADTKVCKEATCQAKQAAYKAVVHQPTAKPVHFQQTKHHLCLNQPNIAVKITSIRKCQAKQAADKTVVHHQPAKLASFHETKGKLMPRSTQHYKKGADCTKS